MSKCSHVLFCSCTRRTLKWSRVWHCHIWHCHLAAFQLKTAMFTVSGDIQHVAQCPDYQCRLSSDPSCQQYTASSPTETNHCDFRSNQLKYSSVISVLKTSLFHQNCHACPSEMRNKAVLWDNNDLCTCFFIRNMD